MIDVDDEIKQYLRLLLNHSKDCENQECPSHAMLHEICGIIRERIFVGPMLADVDGGYPAIHPRRRREDSRADSASLG